MTLNLLPNEILSEIYRFLDPVSLARLEGSHKCTQTFLAWADVVHTRFQLSMANPPCVKDDISPRELFRRLLSFEGSQSLFFFKLSDAALTKTANCNLRHLLRMTLALPDQEVWGEVLRVYCVTTPSQETSQAWQETSQASQETSCPSSCGCRAPPDPNHLTSRLTLETHVYQHWIMLRELTQRGIIAQASLLTPLKAGDEVFHVGRLQTGMSGMSSLLRDGGDFQVKLSRVNAVFNGIVQYQEMSDPYETVGQRPRVGWAARADMLVLLID